MEMGLIDYGSIAKKIKKNKNTSPQGWCIQGPGASSCCGSPLKHVTP